MVYVQKIHRQVLCTLDVSEPLCQVYVVINPCTLPVLQNLIMVTSKRTWQCPLIRTTLSSFARLFNCVFQHLLMLFSYEKEKRIKGKSALLLCSVLAVAQVDPWWVEMTTFMMLLHFSLKSRVKLQAHKNRYVSDSSSNMPSLFLNFKSSSKISKFLT